MLIPTELQNNPDQISIYIHWPFCLMKCPYCDFNSYASSNIDHIQWENSYLKSLDIQLPFLQNKKILSVFFGGGTPSLMQPSTVKKILDKIYKINNNQEIKEITLEANPSTIEFQKFNDFKQAGINRLSIGIQSFNDEYLKFLGRNHNKNEAIQALEIARSVFSEMSFDLIMGLPNQTIEQWKNELNIAKQFIKNHISIYQLTIEKGTPFHKKNIPIAKEDTASEMYLHNISELEKINIHQYEISNFATLSHESIHNINYWIGGQYAGIGPNAHGRIFHNKIWYASSETKAPVKWKNNVDITYDHINNPNCDIVSYYQNLGNLESISENSRKEEILMTYLRLNTVIPNYLLEISNLDKISILEEEGFLTKTHNGIILTQKGSMCLNQLIYYILS